MPSALPAREVGAEDYQYPFQVTTMTRTCAAQSLPQEAEEMVDELPTDREAAAYPEVVRTKSFFLPPMSLGGGAHAGAGGHVGTCSWFLARAIRLL